MIRALGPSMNMGATLSAATGSNVGRGVLMSNAVFRRSPSGFRLAFRKLTKPLLRHPTIVAGTSVSLRYMIGDLLVQKVTTDEDIDPVRTLLFGTFGMAYASTIGYTVYNRLYACRLFVGRPLLTAAVDVVTHMPLLYFPAFYIIREMALCPDRRLITEQPLSLIKSGLATARQNSFDDIKAGVGFWFPCHVVNFMFFPLHLRQPIMAFVGLAWAMLLSTMRGSKADLKSTTSSKPLSGNVALTTHIMEDWKTFSTPTGFTVSIGL